MSSEELEPFICPDHKSPEPQSSFQSLIFGIGTIKKWISDSIKSWYRWGKHPDFFKTFFELSSDQELENECHTVTTDDGYILSLFRLKDSKTKKGAPVVFLQHGILASAENWVMNGENSVAFMLAKRGYDVWLGNHRGTKYSRNHVTLDPNKDEQFWQFSFQELGDFDMPASIDYVREQTGVKKLTYIGHSQGTTQMFYALGTK